MISLACFTLFFLFLVVLFFLVHLYHYPISSFSCYPKILFTLETPLEIELVAEGDLEHLVLVALAAYESGGTVAGNL